MDRKYDVLVLGAGNAGMGAAGVAREAGKSVAMVESRDVGGTCPIRGCVPKKVLVAAAQVLHQIELAGEHHIEIDRPRLDWAALIAREQGFVEGVPEAFAESLANRGIDLYEGAARFTGPHSVAVGDTVIEAAKIVIATGSTPRPLPIPGAEHLITSEEILTDTRQPEHLVFIGGGVIALEFGHVLARAGTKVTILEAMDRLLPRMDEDAVEQVAQESARIGIDIVTGVAVEAVRKTEAGLEVVYAVDGETRTITADRVANGAGRVADVERLDLDTGHIEHDGARILVDQHLRSVSNPDVYVAGDALHATPQLSPAATYEGRLVGRNITEGDTLTPDHADMPAGVYTVPALATVGLTEREAEDKGLDVEVKTSDMSGWRSAKTYAETVAWSKVLIDRDTDRIVGAHIVGHGAEEIIHLFAFAMKHGVTATEMKDTVYGYPTFASDIKYMV